jgi:hypothetical protein
VQGVQDGQLVCEAFDEPALAPDGAEQRRANDAPSVKAHYDGWALELAELARVKAAVDAAKAEMAEMEAQVSWRNRGIHVAELS